MHAQIYNDAGEVVGETALSDAVFGVPMNRALVHQVVVAHLANRRVGTASTKRRGEVEGGGRKPWRQKGTGRARQGSTRAPHWRGGGIVFGPHPRSYTQAIPRKMRRLALRCVLSAKAAEGRLVLLDRLTFGQPRTKDAVALLERLNVGGSALLAIPDLDPNVVLSVRNIPRTVTMLADTLNVVDLMRYEYLVMPVAAVRQIEQWLGSVADESAAEGLAEETATSEAAPEGATEPETVGATTVAKVPTEETPAEPEGE
ncbi:MAG: 50S ribosomal protein L4 [Chloroflexi bacterium]|nr:50S ribosomal protein L4 [Chloroflexota bacterium]